MIDVIQEQAWSLWNDFLEPDFGFKEEYLQVTFSGTEVSIYTTEIQNFSILIPKQEEN